MKRLKTILKLLLFLICIAAVYLSAIIIYATVTDYRPDEVAVLNVEGESRPAARITDTLTFLSWNIGFCGLGAEMDFFYDNGKMVRPADELVEKYTQGVISYLQKNASTDFIILQEVDKNSARTNRQNEIEIISKALPEYFYSYADNYNVKFVPLPFTNPLGKVEAGQMNLSKVKAVSAERISFSSAYAWPKRLFMLDRCFIASRFNLPGGKQLILLNTHNSAYDAGGKLRNIEMPTIRNLMIEEFNKGNYVVAGGDWNQNPPEYDISKVNKTYPAATREILEGNLFPEGWKIIYDPVTPTNREIDAPLKKGITETTIIDYYIVSPNVEVLDVQTVNLDFEHSDHQPVYLKAALTN